MSISVDLSSLDPLHYVTPARVASLRRLIEETEALVQDRLDIDANAFALWLRDAKVLLMALDELVARRRPNT